MVAGETGRPTLPKQRQRQGQEEGQELEQEESQW
jgi:hypothetical protein